MAMRSVAGRSGSSLKRLTEAARGGARWFSDGKGRVLSEEERAAENVYIKKMEKERLEKLKKKAEQEKAAKEKESEKETGTSSEQMNGMFVLGIGR